MQKMLACKISINKQCVFIIGKEILKKGISLKQDSFPFFLNMVKL